MARVCNANGSILKGPVISLVVLLCLFIASSSFSYTYADGTSDDHADANEAEEGDSSDSDEFAHAAAVIGVDQDELSSRMLKIWSLIDTDGDGVVDEEDVHKWILTLRSSMQKKQVAKEVKTIDTDKNGFITLEELKSAYGSGSSSEEQVAEVEKRFSIVDKNKDGQLDTKELSLLMEPADDPELLELETEEILTWQDKDKDGKITFAEFTQGEGSAEEEKELRTEFDLYDANSDGVIDREEILKVIAHPHHQEVENAINEMKNNFEDGKITLESYKANLKDFALSSLTDSGEVLRVPEDYVGLDIPFNNVEARHEAEDEEGDREEL